MYTIDYNNNTTVVVTNETFHLITGLQLSQHYNVTVTALDDSRLFVNELTCLGKTGEGYHVFKFVF